MDEETCFLTGLCTPGSSSSVSRPASYISVEAEDSVGAASLRGGERGRATALCALAVLAGVGALLGVAGLADLASSPKGKTSERRLGHDGRWMLGGSHGRGLMSSCTFDNQWVSTKWDTLSKQESGAWMTLGWVKKVWDDTWGASILGVTTTTTTLPPTTTFFGDTTFTTTYWSYVPMTENTCWQNMNEDQTDAAIALGYTITRWMQCKRKNCMWPPGVPTLSSTCLVKMAYLESKFNNTRTWMNITQMQRDNLVLLGYDPDGNAWKSGRSPASFGRPWSELTVRERDAAMFLSYDMKIWENCEKATDSPCLQRLEHLEAKQGTYVWEALKAGTRERLGDLGWQSRTWFEGDTPAVMKAEWLGLTSMQRSAARILGYSQDTWKSCPDATCLDRFAYTKKRWKGVGWMQMKLSERRAWMLLGHSESLWNGNNLASTMQKRWQELTPEQQQQAMFLGHSEGTWQGCNTDWTGRNVTTGANATTVDPSGAVRARMRIDRPYSEISGNVYGKQVASMPTSFIRVFENAIARALFCGNPPLSFDPKSYLGADSEPLCVQKTAFEKQKYRIRVLNVVEGSIVVDFFIVANSTDTQITARLLFEALVRQVNAKMTSPVCHDKYFGRFAKAATIEENPLSSLKWNEMATALNFEGRRSFYTPSNMCVLHTDAKEGVTSCGSSAAAGLPRSFRSRDFAGFLLALLALSLALSA